MTLPPLPPVLLVDDNEDALHLTKRALANAGVKNPVITFDDAAEALEFLKAASRTPDSHLLPCAVFTDLNMPRMDGLEFVRSIRADTRIANLTVVMLTNSGEESDRKRAETAGVDQFHLKPARTEIVGQIVSDAVKPKART